MSSQVLKIIFIYIKPQSANCLVNNKYLYLQRIHLYFTTQTFWSNQTYLPNILYCAVAFCFHECKCVCSEYWLIDPLNDCSSLQCCRYLWSTIWVKTEKFLTLIFSLPALVVSTHTTSLYYTMKYVVIFDSM